MTCARRPAGVRKPASSTGSPRGPEPRPGRRRARLSHFLPVVALLFAALGPLAAGPAQAQQVPAAPMNLNVVPGNTTLNLTWTAPTGTLTGYDVHYTSSSSRPLPVGSNPATAWVAVDRSTAGTTASQTISGLSNDTLYWLRVRAKNASGSGAWLKGQGTPAVGVCDRTTAVRDALAPRARKAPFDMREPARRCAYVTATDLARVTSLNVMSKGITAFRSGDFDGLTALRELYALNNQLTALPDLSNLTALTYLNVSENRLTALPDLSKNTALTELLVSSNQLTRLPDLSKNTRLTKLWVSNNRLTALPDLSRNTALTRINAQYNQLTALPDLSRNTALANLNVSENRLTALPDLSKNTRLTELWAFSNQLTALPDLSNLTALTRLYVSKNRLTALSDWSNLTALADLDVSNNRLTALPDWSNLTALGNLHVGNNPLSNLSALTLTGSDGKVVALNPTFDSATTTYTATVASGVTNMDVAPTAADTGVMPSHWASFYPAPAIIVTRRDGSLDMSGIPIVITVQGRSGEIRIYTVTVTREAVAQEPPEPEPEPQTQQAAGPLGALFEGVPSEHDGKGSFWFNVRFSEALGAEGKAPTAASFAVSGGKLKRVRQVNARLWRVRVQPDSWRDVTVTLASLSDCAAKGAVCTSDGRALSNTASATIGGPVRIQLKGGKAREGRDATLGFAVTLSRAASAEVSVDYATADGTATAGADYTAVSGTLTFAPGETAKTVTVAILDDAIDEGKEKFYLRLSNPQGAYLRNMHREATGTIRNDDPLQKMWLSRFGRTVASDAVAAVTARFETPRDAGSHVTVAGQRLDLSQAEGGQALAEALTGFARAFGAGEAPAANDDDPFALTRGPSAETTADAPSGRELLLGTSFRAVLASGAGMQLTSWGQGASVSRFSAEVPGLGLSGETATGVMGMDYERGRLLTGFAMMHSVGEGTAHDEGLRYAMGSTVTTVLPYARYTLSDRVSAWGMAGTGSGRMTLDLDGAVSQRYGTDLTMTLAAAGVRGDLLTPAEAGGFALALKADAFWVRAESDGVSASGFGNLAAARGEASRVRAVLDGSRTFALAGGATLSPSVELGLRQDGGDAETGTGLEYGAGLGYADPSRGLDMTLRVHGLAVHAEEGYDEWGVSGQLRLVPGGAGRGLSASLTPSWGAEPAGSERLWAQPTASGLAANGDAPMSSRLDAEAGYGMAVFGDRFTGTPNVGFGLSDTAREYRMGWRLTSAVPNDPGFEVNLDATRREAANSNAPADHGVMLRSLIRW